MKHYGVYAIHDDGEIRMIVSDLSAAGSYQKGMVYTEQEAINIANMYVRKTGLSAFVAKESD